MMGSKVSHCAVPSVKRVFEIQIPSQGVVSHVETSSPRRTGDKFSTNPKADDEGNLVLNGTSSVTCACRSIKIRSGYMMRSLLSALLFSLGCSHLAAYGESTEIQRRQERVT